MQGQGVSRDYSEAEKWFRVAAEGGHGDAAYNLGLLYLHRLPDQSGQPDEAQASKYFRVAADQGIGDGQCSLGMMYAESKGLPKDLVLAYQWMLIASQYGAEQCLPALKTLEKGMRPDQVDEAKRLASAWRPQPHPGFNY
jgi:TPR repeat protein